MAFGKVIVLAFVLLNGGAAYGQSANVDSVSSIGDLQSYSGRATVLIVKSYYPGGRSGGGTFIFDQANQSSSDSCTAFPAKGGRWIRQNASPLDVTMCGAYWDGVHDDAAAISNAIGVARKIRTTVALPGGVGKVCSSVKSASGVIIRGQGMGTAGAIAGSPTLVDGSCMKAGWVFDLVNPKGTEQVEAPKYYDMSIRVGENNAPGGCIRWNAVSGGFTDAPNSQGYMLHPHAERIYCELGNNIGNQQVGLECSKCFDGDLSQNNVMYGKTSISLEGSDVMCIGCAGPNRVQGAHDSLIRLVAHGTFGNMDRVVGNEILYPYDRGQRYDAYIFDGARSATIESNHIEGITAGAQSVIHVAGGFSHTIANNDINVLLGNGASVPHWLIAEGPFVNFRATNNGCGGCILGPALFTNRAKQYNNGGVPQIITHEGNAGSGDSGFP